MSGVLRYTIVVRHPDTAAATALLAGESVPDWASGLVHVDDVESGGAASEGGPPPRAGRGSSAEAWREYADVNDVQVEEDASRDDIISALDVAGVSTE